MGMSMDMDMDMCMHVHGHRHEHGEWSWARAWEGMWASACAMIQRNTYIKEQKQYNPYMHLYIYIDMYIQPYICVITNTLMVAIRMTMMLKRMLTVFLGVREHEYDNGDDDDDDDIFQLQTKGPKCACDSCRWADAAAA